MDLETGAIVAATLYGAAEGDGMGGERGRAKRSIPIGWPDATKHRGLWLAPCILCISRKVRRER